MATGSCGGAGVCPCVCLPFSGFRLPRLLLPLLCPVLNVLCSKREVHSCDGIVAKFMISLQLSVLVCFCSQNHTPVSSASERGLRASFGVEMKFPATPVTAPESVLTFGMKMSPPDCSLRRPLPLPDGNNVLRGNVLYVVLRMFMKMAWR